MVLIKGVKQYPDIGLKIVHLYIDYNSAATDRNKEENNDDHNPMKPYDGENMNAYSDDEGNNDEDDPET